MIKIGEVVKKKKKRPLGIYPVFLEFYGFPCICDLSNQLRELCIQSFWVFAVKFYLYSYKPTHSLGNMFYWKNINVFNYSSWSRHYCDCYKIYGICWFQFTPSATSNSLRPHGLQHARLPWPSPTLGACSNSCPSSWWCHPTISSSVVLSPPAFNLSQNQGLF